MIGQMQGLDLLLLPEMWSTGFTMKPESIAEIDEGPALQWMKKQSQILQSVVAGSISVSNGHQYFNRWYAAYPDGYVAQYDKKHLFSYGHEDDHYTPGIEKIIIEIKGWRIMPIICYDLRFPVWCRNTNAYDLMLVSANWPVPRIHHWDALLKARAIENQCYVAAVNRIGNDENGLAYNGHSSVYNMNGEMSLDLKSDEAIGRISLDKEVLSAYREQFQFLQDRDEFTL